MCIVCKPRSPEGKKDLLQLCVPFKILKYLKMYLRDILAFEGERDN